VVANPAADRPPSLGDHWLTTKAVRALGWPAFVLLVVVGSTLEYTALNALQDESAYAYWAGPLGALLLTAAGVFGVLLRGSRVRLRRAVLISLAAIVLGPLIFVALYAVYIAILLVIGSLVDG
jgi:hypothetical protein